MPTSSVIEHSETPLNGGTAAGERIGAAVGVGVGCGVGVACEVGAKMSGVVTGDIEGPDPFGVLAHAPSSAIAPAHAAIKAPRPTFLFTRPSLTADEALHSWILTDRGEIRIIHRPLA